MKHLAFSPDSEGFDTLLLIKQSAFNEISLRKYYVDELDKVGARVLGLSLDYNSAGKAPVKTVIEPCLEQVMNIAKFKNIKLIMVQDAAYFKKLAKVTKAEPQLGYVVPCPLEGFEDIHITYGINYTRSFRDDDILPRLDFGNKAACDFIAGTLQTLGEGIIHSAVYADTPEQLKAALEPLLEAPMLACDVETFGLHIKDFDIGTIAFSSSKHEGIAASVCCKNQERVEAETERLILREFFEAYQGTLVFHNAGFDCQMLIRYLWMDNWYDYEGMYKGIDCLLKQCKAQDTKIIAYLALNACGADKSRYGLKSLAHEFAGNYAQSDINDITKIPSDALLEYNLVDCLSTIYVYETYFPRLVEDEQLQIYNEMFLPSLALMLEMQIVGMPIDLDRVQDAKRELSIIAWENEQKIRTNPRVKAFEQVYREAMAKQYNETHKKKRKTARDFLDYRLNPGSPDQLQDFLYTWGELPVIEKTDTGQPATGAKVLKNLVNHTDDTDMVNAIDSFIRLAKADKILSTFIKAFESKSIIKEDDQAWLHGSYNLGGTVSGRLSSSGPNMTNLPSGSTFGKLIKKCFRHKTKLFGGADFASLEDRADALLTKDSNKIKVYTDNYDGHCLRAYGYFGEQMEGIDPESVESINSIKDAYPQFRQDSKAPTFALTYAGTFKTLMTNCGFSRDVAISIETNYHKLYIESDEWKNRQLVKIQENGYATVAFGLRVRCPALAKTKGTPLDMLASHEAAESRTVGNAIGQSYGMLTNRAFMAVMARVRDSKFRGMILPVCQIHDAMYFVFEEDLELVEFLNNAVSEEMRWQDDPAIAHPKVGLEGELDLFLGGWHNPCTLKNFMTQEEIKTKCTEHLKTSQ